MSREIDEQGTLLIWVCVLCAVCMMVAISLSKVGYATKSIAQAQNAADSAALSAAYEIAHSNQDLACNSANVAAGKNNARVISCKYTNENVEITVTLKSNAQVQAKARAEIE